MPRTSMIRSATLKDLPELARMSERIGFPNWTQTTLAEELERGAPRAEILVAEQGRVCGFCLTWLVMDRAELLFIGVDLDARGRGIGEILLHRAEHNLVSAGAVSIGLEVAASNTVAARFYQRLGYTIVGRRPKYYPNGDAAILMDRVL